MTNVNGASPSTCKCSQWHADPSPSSCAAPAEQPFASPAGAAAAAIMRGTSMVSRPGLSRQNSGLRGNGPSTASPLQAVGKSLTSTVAKEEGRVDIGGFQPPAFKLESTAACQLITYIYSAKVTPQPGYACIETMAANPPCRAMDTAQGRPGRSRRDQLLGVSAAAGVFEGGTQQSCVVISVPVCDVLFLICLFFMDRPF